MASLTRVDGFTAAAGSHEKTAATGRHRRDDANRAPEMVPGGALWWIF